MNLFEKFYQWLPKKRSQTFNGNIIESLPVEIIHYIQTFLNSADAARLAQVSRCLRDRIYSFKAEGKNTTSYNALLQEFENKQPVLNNKAMQMFCMQKGISLVKVFMGTAMIWSGHRVGLFAWNYFQNDVNFCLGAVIYYLGFYLGSSSPTLMSLPLGKALVNKEQVLLTEFKKINQLLNEKKPTTQNCFQLNFDNGKISSSQMRK